MLPNLVLLEFGTLFFLAVFVAKGCVTFREAVPVTACVLSQKLLPPRPHLLAELESASEP